jgi:glycosyltransferase involved in cell wall biosynthesis
MDSVRVPFVSVIVPTYNRVDLLKRTIESLLNQSYPTGSYEIIVIDNSSTDGTEEMVHSFQERAASLLRYYRKENKGPGSSRNLGVKKARGDFIAFTDSDCVADPDWLKNGIGKMTEGVGIVQGKTLPNPEQQQGTLHQTMKIVSEDAYYPTCNIFYRKESLDHVQGFSPEFCGLSLFGKPRWGGEDTDLAWKVKKEGWKSTFADNAIVYHHIFPVASLRSLLKAMHLDIIFILARNYKKHPGIRDSLLYMKIFKSRQRALFYLFIFSLVFGIWGHWFFFFFGFPYMMRLVRVSFYGRRLETYHRGIALFSIIILQETIESILSICASLVYRTVIL